MFSRYVRFWQLVELAAYAGLVAWLRGRPGWSVGAAIALSLGVALGWRFAFVALSLFLGWVYRSPRPPEQRIGLAGALALVAREYRAFLVYSLVHLPWERLVLRPDPVPAPASGTPIILVHGYFANRGYLRRLVGRIERAGLGPVFVPNLRSWLASIERFEVELDREVERVASGTGKRVVLVAHSMGGLGSRLYLARRGHARVCKLVTIASPHHGTAVAPLGLGENARQMRRGSDFLRELAAAEKARGSAVPTVSIYTPHDNMVMPQATSRLDWARDNIAIPGRGHIDIIESDELWRVLEPELREAAGLGAS